jgi:hypothetical protein
MDWNSEHLSGSSGQPRKSLEQIRRESLQSLGLRQLPEARAKDSHKATEFPEEPRRLLDKAREVSDNPQDKTWNEYLHSLKQNLDEASNKWNNDITSFNTYINKQWRYMARGTNELSGQQLHMLETELKRWDQYISGLNSSMKDQYIMLSLASPQNRVNLASHVYDQMIKNLASHNQWKKEWMDTRKRYREAFHKGLQNN